MPATDAAFPLAPAVPAMPTLLARHYLLVVALVMLGALAISAGWILHAASGGRLAPVPLSGNVSFDEKMEWLWKRGERRWDVLAAGSSMTLNNLDGGEVARRLPAGSSLVNCASWSLKIPDTRALVEYLAGLHRPRAVVMVCGPMDFYAGKSGLVKPDEIESYRTTATYGVLVARHFDPLYYYDRADGIATQRVSRDSYSSLAYDDWGDVPLHVRYPNVDAVRWNTKPQPALIDRRQYDEFDRLVGWLADHRIHLVCAQAPIRDDAYAACDRAGLDAHWARLEAILSRHGFRFYNLHRTLALGRECFADYSHLNDEGARLFTVALMDAAGSELQDP